MSGSISSSPGAGASFDDPYAKGPPQEGKDWKTGRPATGREKGVSESDFQSVRAFALSLPEVAEAPHFDKTSFRVRGKIIATAPSDGRFLHVFIDESQARALAAGAPAAFEELWWGKRLAGVRIKLDAADADLVFSLIEDAWCMRAPKSLVSRLERDRQGDS